MGFTRIRDLATVLVVAAIAGYLLVRFSYGRIPTLPRFAGVAAAVLGIGEAVFGWGIRARLRASRDADGRPSKPPVPPLVAARAVMTAKATSLAGAALTGLWIGLLAYVVPLGQVVAAGADTATGFIGLVCALVMVGGALWLENCCRTPVDGPGDPRR